ncbi:DEAD/DEAH box helicase [Ornithinimicrobium sp. F0845]|uniref:DEAD/DEAH box helicase n=1 Tax=Ornithinimicrobium sp. F0845 TaxID=2926412 RepID=UPI001FF32459|nr:DEAD/DEAH box helicase [Ornithinimicrobium sp. F0845]MCK0114051.1 DEAD/DEAH box helicase [Ornithinimicrobium sp. F0845]
MTSNPREPHSFVAPSWVLDVTEDDLLRAFGRTSLTRGRTYQRRGVVRNLSVTQSGVITSTVHGTRRYRTTVSQTARRPDGRTFAAHCSCPVGITCKHAAATILEAQARARAGDLGAARPASRVPTEPSAPSRPIHVVSQPAVPDWEALLAPVVAETEPPAPSPAVTPLALHLEAGAGPSRSGPGRQRLEMRPLMRGASGAWIKTGVSWSDVQSTYGDRQWGAAQRSALAALLNATRTRTGYWYTLTDTIEGGSLGPALWPMLREVEQAGVPLVTGYQGKERVHLRAEPVELALDLTRTADGALALQTVLGLPGEPAILGDPGHGLVSTVRGELHLAALAKPLTPALTRLFSGTAPTIPESDTDRFLTGYYPALRQHVTVTSSDDSVEFPEIKPPRLGLEVRFEAHHRTRLRWTFRYAVGQAIRTVPLLRAPTGEDGPLVRDAAREEELLASLSVLDGAPGLRVPLPGRNRLGVVIEPQLDGWDTVQFVNDVLPALEARDDIDISVFGEPLDYDEADEPPVVAVSTRDPGERGPGSEPDGIQLGEDASRDWFDLGIEVTVGDQPVPLPDLLAALAHGAEQLILPDGTWFSVDVPELHALRRLVEEARALQDHEGEGLRINRFQAGLWEELVSLGVVAEQSERWQRTVGDLLALEELPHPDPPEGLTASLRSYQLDGFQWLSFLWEHELGGILADDMGLGKTVQVLAAAERAREQGLLSPERPMLVVAPTSVVGAWVREAERFTPGLRVAALTETVRRSGRPLTETITGAHMVVTSYALLRIDEEHLTGITWSAVVLDEAQAVKNHRSRTYQAARSLRAPVKFAVTGTPLENSLMDLWSLLSIVAPGLFSSPQKFGEVFRKPIESGSAPELLATLRRRVRPLMLRRTKEAVAPDLPPKIEQVLSVALNPAHRRIYDTHLQRERQRILGLLDDVDRNRIAILSALTKLRQLSLDVHLVEPDAPTSVRPSKVDVLIEQLVEVAAEGHRCLVFSQFTRFLRIVRERLDAEGIGHVYLDGRTRDRPRRVAQFTDGDDPVFLISLKAGGSGLTLTEADYVFVLDPWWNPAVEAQAVDRTHRIGQDSTVMVYRLVAEDTIEEKVVALQEKKRDLFAKVVDDEGLMSAPLSADDIRALVEG